MGKYTLIRNPSNNSCSYGKIGNLKIKNEPQLALTEADIYLFQGFHKRPHGFGFKHIRTKHDKEIRNRGFINESNDTTLIPEYVASIVRPGALLYYEGEIRKDPRLLASNRTGKAVLEFRKNDDRGMYWSIITVYDGKPHGRFVGKIV